MRHKRRSAKSRFSESPVSRSESLRKTGEFVQPLGKAGVVSDDALGRLDRLAALGLPLPAGFILGRRAHLNFIRESGLEEQFLKLTEKGCEAGVEPDEDFIGELAHGLRLGCASRPLGRELAAEIREALVGLGADTVVVFSGTRRRPKLGTIPSVISALEVMWLDRGRLEGQMRAAIKGLPVPTWPVLIQREVRPEKVCHTTLRSVEPQGVISGSERERLACLTLEAGYALGENLRLECGFERGDWCVISVEPFDTASS